MPDTLPPLPSLYRPLRAAPGAPALEEAVRLAPSEGAGLLVWGDLSEACTAAVVLEPEMPLAQARLAWLAGASAFADALGVLAPAELPLGFDWPAVLRVNGGRCGRVSLRVAAGATPRAIPDWLVVGVRVRLRFPPGHEPGLKPDETSLLDEGWTEATAADIIEAWARHLMANLDEWQARGPQRVAERFLARLLKPAAAPGLKRGIDPATGRLVLDRDGVRDEWELAE